MGFTITQLQLPGLVLITPQVFSDARGEFLEIFKKSDFAKNGIAREFVQVNHSRSKKGVLRGLHYQKGAMAQGKLVRVLSGEIYDVALDMRKGSPTFGKWTAQKLDDVAKKMFYVPEGFAHGFQALSDGAEVEYLCTKEYSAPDDRGVLASDPELAITWPIPSPVMSEKDRRHPVLAQAENDFVYGESVV